MKNHHLGDLIVGFLSLFVLCCMADDHYYDFYVTEKNITNPCASKNFTLVVERVPGQTIHVHRGDTAFINVHNEGTYGITIHWHGVKQPRNPWSDGPAYVTQCPIKPGKNFTYEVIFSDEEGTLWWHAHSDWSRATVHGAIAVLPPKDTPFPFDPQPYEEHVIVLGEWFSGNVTEFVDTEEKRHTKPSLSDAYTINGLFNCTADEGYSLLVERGRTYLLRIVGAAMDDEMFFAVAHHNLTVVGQDGSYVKPITTTYIMITPGQTFDVLLTADQRRSYYYMAVGPYDDGDAPRNSSISAAILQYRGSCRPPVIPYPNQLPGVADTGSAKNFTDQIKSRDSVNLPEKPDEKIFIAVTVSRLRCGEDINTCNENGTEAVYHASLNNISFMDPKIDILQAYHRSMSNIYETDFPAQPPTTLNFTGDDSEKFKFPILGTNISIIEYNQSVEIVFQGTNKGAENHPMHLHGYSFYLVATGDGNFNETEYKNNLNLIDPPNLNTVGVPRNGWVAIRFVANNPGVWFMHCHLERHALWGMDTVLIVKNGITENQSIREPPNGLPECSSSTTGNIRMTLNENENS